MGVIDNVSQRQYTVNGSQAQSQPMQMQGFQVSGAANVGVGSPGTGFAMTLLVVLGGLLVTYAATRRIQGA